MCSTPSARLPTVESVSSSSHDTLPGTISIYWLSFLLCLFPTSPFVFPGISSPINYLPWNPCLRVCFWGIHSHEIHASFWASPPKCCCREMCSKFFTTEVQSVFLTSIRRSLKSRALILLLPLLLSKIGIIPKWVVYFTVLLLILHIVFTAANTINDNKAN